MIGRIVAGFIIVCAAVIGWLSYLDSSPTEPPERRLVVGHGEQTDPMLAVMVLVGEQEEAARLEAERLADEQKRQELARMAAVSSRATERVVATGDCSAIPGWFPAEIAWRESRCTRGIDTGNGYLGYAQVARFHWSNLCVDLDWTVDSEYDECVSRLWDGGAGARHWGG